MHDIISDYKTELSDSIDGLFDDIVGEDGEYRSHSYRYVKCDNLIEDYFEISGEVPPSNMLDRMASYLLKDDNRRSVGKKHTVREYPYLSDQQYERRIAHEAAFSAAETYDIEGINQRVLTRQLRIESELANRRMK